MRLLFPLTLLVGVSQQQNIKQRITYNLGIWTNAAAHCAEFATKDSVIITEKAEECMRCWAGVGDWATPDTPLLNGPISSWTDQRSGILHIVRDP